MTATPRWNPATEMTSLRDAMSQLLEGSVVRPGFAVGGAGMASFPVNLYRAGDELKVEALIPGASPEDIDLTVHQGVLTIGATRHGWEPGKGERAYVREISGGQFTRSFSLPFPVDVERVAADYANGVLTLTLPVAEAAQPKKIPLAAGRPQPIASGEQR